MCSSCNAVLSSITQGHTIDGSGTCSDCKHDITSGHTHDYSNFVETVSAANCYTKAQNKYSCTICGSTTIIAEGDLLEHTWNSGVVTTEPTTITEGVRTYTCTVTGCGATKTEAIEMIEKSDNTLTLSATSGTVTYPTSKTFTISTNTSNGKISAESSNTNIATVSVSENTITVIPGTTAGTVTITVTSSETDMYKSSTATYTATVKNGTLSVTSSGYNGVYDGAAHGITVNCATEGVTITYSTSSNGTYTSTKPTYTEQGYYITYYKVQKAGYTDYKGQNSVNISAKTLNYYLSNSNNVGYIVRYDYVDLYFSYNNTQVFNLPTPTVSAWITDWASDDADSTTILDTYTCETIWRSDSYGTLRIYLGDEAMSILEDRGNGYLNINVIFGGEWEDIYIRDLYWLSTY